MLPTPTLTFGDLHGRPCWRAAGPAWVARSPHHRVVFLGDYVDSFDIPLGDQAENLRQVIAFKQQYPDQVILLLGNHDAHYLWPDAPRGSGFKPINHAQLFPVFQENQALFQIAYEAHGTDGQRYLWTHAGVSQPWAESLPPVDLAFPENARPTLADVLNAMAQRADLRALLLRVGSARNRRQGEHRDGGPLWADLSELSRPLPTFHQIVGHTALKEPAPLVIRAEGIDHTSVTNCDFNEFTLGLDNVRVDFFYQL